MTSVLSVPYTLIYIESAVQRTKENVNVKGKLGRNKEWKVRQTPAPKITRIEQVAFWGKGVVKSFENKSEI